MIVGRQPTAGQRFLTSTDWDGYSNILEALKDRRIKVTYDQGALELLSPSKTHEQIRKLLVTIIEFALFEKRTRYFGGGSTTFRRKFLEKGLEPDDCFYFDTSVLENADEEDCPIPELALEVEHTQSVLNRLGIYEALGVHEVWRYTSEHRVVILRLGDGGYVEVEKSDYLPFFPGPEVVRFVKLGLKILDNVQLLEELRAWLSEHE